MKRLMVFSLIIPALFVLSGCQEGRVLKRGDVPGSVVLSDLEGKRLTVPDDFRGQVVMVRFWADWCPYCADEMKAIESIYGKYKEKGFVVLAINVAQSGEVARKFVDTVGISYPVLLDPDSSTARSYGVASIPTTFILDRKGVIREKILGESAQDVLEQLVTGIL